MSQMELNTPKTTTTNWESAALDEASLLTTIFADAFRLQIVIFSLIDLHLFRTIALAAFAHEVELAVLLAQIRVLGRGVLCALIASARRRRVLLARARNIVTVVHCRSLRRSER